MFESQRLKDLRGQVEFLQRELAESRRREHELTNKIVLLAGLRPIESAPSMSTVETPGESTTTDVELKLEPPKRRSLSERKAEALAIWRMNQPRAEESDEQ